MSTGSFENWAGTITDIGPIYPFVGTEMLLVIAGLVFWIWWHIAQSRQEKKSFQEELDVVGNKEALSKIVAGEDPEHPYAAFRLGTTQILPHFGRDLDKSAEVVFFYLVYDLGVDPANSKGDADIVFSILKGGRSAVAEAPPNTVNTPFAASAVGPVPMGPYPPGGYVAQLRVTDRVTKKTVVQNERFKIVAPEGAAP